MKVPNGCPSSVLGMWGMCADIILKGQRTHNPLAGELLSSTLQVEALWVFLWVGAASHVGVIGRNWSRCKLRPVLGSKCCLGRLCDQPTLGAKVRVSMLGTEQGT